MFVSEHFKYRYCQRIVGIKKHKEILQYIARNDELITSHCLKMFTYSTFIGHGNVSVNISRNFYLRGNLILISDVNNRCLVTLFKRERNNIKLENLIKRLEEEENEIGIYAN